MRQQEMQREVNERCGNAGNDQRHDQKLDGEVHHGLASGASSMTASTNSPPRGAGPTTRITSVLAHSKHFPDWPVRRLNSALNYLDNAKLIHPLKALDSSPWTTVCLHVTDRTRRFARDHG
jgi:hypothetical protein